MNENEKKFPVVEIFESIQGEGILLGELQIFIRLAGCNLKCEYCDTKFDEFTWMTKQEILGDISQYSSSRTLVFTGGEPLLNSDLIFDIYDDLKKRNLKIMLETNGILFNELQKVIDKVDIISCDFKLFEDKNSQKEFFRIMLENKKRFYIKIVFSDLMAFELFTKEIEFLSENISKDIPIVLQPITFLNEKVKYSKISENFQKVLLSKFDNVFFIPQMHKLLGVR